MSIVDDFIKKRKEEMRNWIKEAKENGEIELLHMQYSNTKPEVFLSNLVGQENAKILLQFAAERALISGKALRHVLLTGPAGVGKSTLARAVTNEVNGSIHECLGTDLGNPAKFDAMMRFIRSNEYRRVVFIDEIHATPGKVQEKLYSPMQDFMYEGKTLAEFTVIGATTDQSKLLRPMRDRFTYSIEVEPYTEGELVKIITDKFPTYDDNVAKYIAKRSKGVARIAIEHSKKVEDIYQGSGDSIPTMEHATFAMMVSRINPDGLSSTDLMVLINLSKAGRPLSKNTLASVVDVSPEDLEALYEPFMIKKGLIVKTPRGREITDMGRAYLQANVQSSLEIGVKEILEVTNA